MKKPYYVSILLFSLILLSLPQIVLAQEERLAVVSTFDGEIKIQHDGVWKTVTKIGNRVKNSSVYSDDTVLTMPGSTAVLIFNDNSRLEVKESTTMTISEKQMTDQMAQQGFVTPVSGTLKKEIVRNIKIKAGGLWASVTPSKSVLTEFETPTGVASVRGTELSVSFDAATGIAAIDLGDGRIEYVSPGRDAIFDMGTGDSVHVAVPESGRGVALDVVSGDIEVNTPTGDVVNMNTGDGVEVGSTDTGDTSVTVTATGDDGEVTVDTDAGTVEMTTDDAVEVGTTDSGDISVVVTATGEDGGVTLETDEGTISIAADASLEVAIDPDTGEMAVAETAGEVTITTEDGTTNVEVGDDIGTAPPEGNVDDDIAAAIEAGASPGALGTPVDEDGGGDDGGDDGGGDGGGDGGDGGGNDGGDGGGNDVGGDDGGVGGGGQNQNDLGSQNTDIVQASDPDPVNNPPVVVDMDVTTNEDDTKTITLTATDADGDDLTSNSFAIVDTPENGTLSPITIIDETTVEVTYTPNADANGPDSFTFKVDDGTDSSNTATVNITVNDILNKGSEAMELLNHYGIGGASIPEDPSSVVIGNDLFPNIDISPAGYIHGWIENRSGDGSDNDNADGFISSIYNDGDNNDGIIYDDGFGISFNEDGDSADYVATFRDVDDGDSEDEGPNIEQGGTKGTSFYSRATGNSVVANTSFKDLLISHDYKLTDDGNLLIADVTITNAGNKTISNLKYRKKTDFDVDEWDDTVADDPIDDFIVPSIDPDTLIEYVAAPYAGYNASTNPLSSDTTNSVSGTHTGDNAAVIQLNLGTLGPDESITFPVFFAGDDSPANLQASIDNAVSATYIEVSDPSESNAVFALGSGTSNLNTPTGVIVEDKDHFKLLTDSMSLLIGHLSKESYSSHAETIVNSSNGLYNPAGIAVHDGDLYVADDGVGKVFQISESGGVWSVVDIDPSGDVISQVTAVATDKDGNLYVTGYDYSWDPGVFRVVDTGSGWDAEQIASSGEGLYTPTGIAVDHGFDLNNISDDKIYVTDDDEGKVFQLINGDGWGVTEVASAVSTDNRLLMPQGIAILRGGELRVVDTGSDAVLKVDPWDGDGDTFRLATEGSTHGKIDEPVDIVEDDDGFLYVVDSHNNSITKVTAGGFEDPKFIASAGTTDTIGNPVGIAIDNNGTYNDTSDDIIYIIDDEKNSVVKLTKTTNDKTLLAFANKLRADLKAHDAGFHDSTESVNLDTIISKIQQNVDSPNTVSNTEIISDLETVRSDLVAHAGLESIFDHVDLAHLIGDARNIAAESSDNGVQLNLDVIETNLDKAKEYINNAGSSTEHDNVMTQINNIKTDIGLVRNNIFDWAAIERVEDGLDDVFESLVDHISPNNNPFAFLKDFSNEDAVDMMFYNGTGGAFIPSLAINTVNKIDNGTLAAGISQDGSLIEPNTSNTNGGIGLILNGFDNGGNENGDVLTPGSPNEGYGVSYDAGGIKFLARVGSGDGANSAFYDTSIYTKGSKYNMETFTHKVGVNRDRDDIDYVDLDDSAPKGGLDITHKFEVASPDLHIGAEGFGYEKMMAVTVTMSNTGTDPITNLKYRRVADFDNGSYGPGGSEFTVPDIGSTTSGDATLESAGAPYFFPSYDPRANFGDSSPDDYTGDRTALLQFDVGMLAADESKTFTFFYAADKSLINLSGNVNSLVTDAKYVSSTRDGSQPYPAFALGTGSSNGIIEEDMSSKESQHFNILSDTMSLMLRDLAKTDYAVRTVTDSIYNPKSVAIDSNGDLIVADEGDPSIFKIEKDGTSPTGYDGENIIVVADYYTWDSDDDDYAWINGPSGVAVNANGDLFVTDQWSSSVLKIEKDDSSPTGYKNKVRVLADYYTKDDVNDNYRHLSDPMGLALNSDGDVIVAGGWKPLIMEIDDDGDRYDYLHIVADDDSSGNLIDHPTGVAVDSKGDIIVTDKDTDAILRVDPVSGNASVIADNATTGLLKDPQDIAIDSYGILTVVGKDNNNEGVVVKVDPVSGDTRAIATEDSTGGKLDDPDGLAIDSDGSIYVAADYNLIVKLEETTSSNYLLAFARKIRGDMEVHDDEHTDAGDATVHADHEDFLAVIDDVIDDIETNINNPNSVDKMGIFDKLKGARDLLMDGHADMKEPVQHTDLAHILLDSKRLADDQVRLNLASIHEAIKQVKIFMAEHINDFGDTTVHRGIGFQIDTILAKIGVLRDDIYDTTAANSIQSNIKETFCDVIDHTVRSDSVRAENPFHFCHGNMDEGGGGGAVPVL